MKPANQGAVLRLEKTIFENGDKMVTRAKKAQKKELIFFANSLI
jgi:hypothetical protein